MKLFFVVFCLAALAACTSPVTTKEVSNLSYNCGDVGQKISLLEKELSENNRRVAAGIRSVLPVSVVVNIVRGRYKENVKIASGKWAKVLKAKIAEMKNYRQNC